ncbi:MAG: hypothetical protein ACYDCO_13960 [Armatimonadota bacterium]
MTRIATFCTVLAVAFAVALIGCGHANDPFVGSWRPVSAATEDGSLPTPVEKMTTLTITRHGDGYTLVSDADGTHHSGRKNGDSVTFTDISFGVGIEARRDGSDADHLLVRYTPPGKAAITVRYERK